MDNCTVTTSTFSIRRATATDADAILQCLSAAFGRYRDRYTPDAFRDTVLSTDTIRDRLASMSVLVAVTPAGEVIGTVASQVTSDDEGHLRGMAVLPSSHGSGVGDALLDAAERIVRGQGCSRISLDTTAPLQRAVRFYERNGYRASGRVRDFFGMPLFEYVKGAVRSALNVISLPALLAVVASYQRINIQRQHLRHQGVQASELSTA